MRNRCFLYVRSVLVLLLICMVHADRSNAGESDSHSKPYSTERIHERFKNVKITRLADETGKCVYVNGLLVPYEFDLFTTNIKKKRIESKDTDVVRQPETGESFGGAIRFRLIPSGKVALRASVPTTRERSVDDRFTNFFPNELWASEEDGGTEEPKLVDVRLSVDRPFYLATTVLSQRQAANVLYGLTSNLDEDESLKLYREFMHAELVAEPHPVAMPGNMEPIPLPDGLVQIGETLDTYTVCGGDLEPGEQERIITAYLDADDQLPALLGDPGLARTITLFLARRYRMIVRPPSLAEWYVAMRGGSNTTYWWGNQWEPMRVVPGRDKREANVFEAIARIQPTTSGDPNPFGLYHMVGNVHQVVDPTAAEREQLRNALNLYDGRGIVGAGKGAEFVYQIADGTLFLAGGSTLQHKTTLPDWVDLRKVLSIQSATTFMPPSLGRNRYFSLVGLRLAMSLPEGSVTAGTCKSESNRDAGAE